MNFPPQSQRRLPEQSLKRLSRDESGAEVIEYVLVLGMISIVAISLIFAFGTKVLARWNSVNAGVP